MVNLGVTTMTCTSTAPMSHPGPCGRLTPRSSVVTPAAPSAWQAPGDERADQRRHRR
jgi:hypothetical protein